MISVVISNFNGAKYLPKLIESLQSQENVELEILVVDRASSDDSARILSEHPGIRVLSLPPEAGLVAGYDLGAKSAVGDRFFFCNEDMWFGRDTLARMSAALDPSRKIGASDGWHWTYDGAEWVHGGTAFRRSRWAVNSPHPRYTADFTLPLPTGAFIPFPCAGAVMILRSLYEECGGWDTRFFLDHEDIDLFLRAWQRGWKCVSVPEARVFHAINASHAHTLAGTGQAVSERRYVGQRVNQAMVALKTFSWPWVGLAALQEPVLWAGHLVRCDGHRLRLDWGVVKEMLRRIPSALKYRKATAGYRYYHPGERFFTDFNRSEKA